MVDQEEGEHLRSPPWTRDELILALDLYIHHKPSTLSQKHPKVVDLSNILNQLPIHGHRPDKAKFRNPNGVYMKLGNFLRLDPTYEGKGLQRGGKLEEQIWNEFHADPTQLGKLASAIKASYKTAAAKPEIAEEQDEEEFPEGKVLYRMHRSRERNRRLAEQVKAAAKKKNGKLACQVCGFNFAESYGTLGDGYIECHHTLPLSSLTATTRTKPQDVALLCSNCHRMVHRRRPWLGISELTTLLSQAE